MVLVSVAESAAGGDFTVRVAPVVALRFVPRLRGAARLRWPGPWLRDAGADGAGSLGGAGWAQEVATDSGRVPGGEAGGDRQIVVRRLASVRAEGGDFALQ